MLGAIIGDIVGSRFEFNNTHSKDFAFFHPDCKITDDSAMTIAVMNAILTGNLEDEKSFKETVITSFKHFYSLAPDEDYGLSFSEWLESDDPKPYNSYGNEACMRISPVAVLSEKWRDVASWATEVSHNHPIALSWATLYVAVLKDLKISDSVDDAKEVLRLALTSTKLPELVGLYYPGNPDESVNIGEFDETVQGTVPVAIKAVLESEDFVDAIRTAVSYGGDSDTIACIAGAMAEAIWGIPTTVRRACLRYIPANMISTVRKFYRAYPEFA